MISWLEYKFVYLIFFYLRCQSIYFLFPLLSFQTYIYIYI